MSYQITALAHSPSHDCAVQEEAATRIQQFYRKHRSTLSLRRRSFSKFGDEAFELIKRCEYSPVFVYGDPGNVSPQH